MRRLEAGGKSLVAHVRGCWPRASWLLLSGFGCNRIRRRVSPAANIQFAPLQGPDRAGLLPQAAGGSTIPKSYSRFAPAGSSAPATFTRMLYSDP